MTVSEYNIESVAVPLRRLEMEKKSYSFYRAITWPIRILFSALTWLFESILQILSVVIGFIGVFLFGIGIFGSIASIPVAIQHGWKEGLAILLVSLIFSIVGRPLTKWFLGVDPIY